MKEIKERRFNNISNLVTKKVRKASVIPLEIVKVDISMFDLE